MLVPKGSVRLISTREDVGKDSGKKPIGLMSVNHYRCLETAVVYPSQNTPRKESLKYPELAKHIGAARNWWVIHARTYRSIQNLLEQRVGPYWSSAQLVSYPQRNLLEQRAGRSKTYWSSAQVEPNLLEQRAGRFCNCLIFNIFSGFLHPYPLNLKPIQL